MKIILSYTVTAGKYSPAQKAKVGKINDTVKKLKERIGAATEKKRTLAAKLAPLKRQYMKIRKAGKRPPTELREKMKPLMEKVKLINESTAGTRAKIGVLNKQLNALRKAAGFKGVVKKKRRALPKIKGYLPFNQREREVTTKPSVGTLPKIKGYLPFNQREREVTTKPSVGTLPKAPANVRSEKTLRKLKSAASIEDSYLGFYQSNPMEAITKAVVAPNSLTVDDVEEILDRSENNGGYNNKDLLKLYTHYTNKKKLGKFDQDIYDSMEHAVKVARVQAGKLYEKATEKRTEDAKAIVENILKLSPEKTASKVQLFAKKQMRVEDESDGGGVDDWSDLLKLTPDAVKDLQEQAKKELKSGKSPLSVFSGKSAMAQLLSLRRYADPNKPLKTSMGQYEYEHLGKLAKAPKVVSAPKRPVS